MIKRIIYLFFLGCTFFNSSGQVTISLHEPPAGVVQKSQLWNITLIYSGGSPTTVSIGLSLFDVSDNQPVMTAFTRIISLSGGVKQLSAAELAPIEYTYLSPSFNTSRMADAFLPIGQYRACYTVNSGTDSKGTILSEDCISIEVLPLSPPQLNFPADSSQLETPYPQFNWIPPAPISLFIDLNYDLIVAEVFPGQSPEAAIQENLPVYLATRLTSMVNNYPASYKSLDTSKLYAWQVVAKNGDQFAAKTEVWTFSINKKQTEKSALPTITYFELQKDQPFLSVGTLSGKDLGIKYYSYDQTHETDIRVISENGEIVKEYKKTIKYGDNYMVFKLDNGFNEEKTYTVELNDQQLSIYKTSFRISK